MDKHGRKVGSEYRQIRSSCWRDCRVYVPYSMILMISLHTLSTVTIASTQPKMSRSRDADPNILAALQRQDRERPTDNFRFQGHKNPLNELIERKHKIHIWGEVMARTFRDQCRSGKREGWLGHPPEAPNPSVTSPIVRISVSTCTRC